MKMSLRWFSEGNDSIKLSDIRQISGGIGCGIIDRKYTSRRGLG